MSDNKIKSFLSKIKAKKKEKNQALKSAKGKVFNLFDKNKFVDVGDKSRVDTKILQIINFAFLVSLTFNVMQFIVMLTLLPLKEKIPYFVHFMPKDEQIVYVEQYKQSKKSQRNIKEYLARDYVKKRETIDLVTENDRWTYIQFISNDEMKRAFEEEFNPKLNNKSIYKYSVDNNILRNVRIISSSVLSDNQYQVEFEIIESVRTNGKVTSTTIAIATISFQENNNQFKGYDYLNNPFGYLVSDYSIGIKQQRVEDSKSVNLKAKTQEKQTKKNDRETW